MRSWPTTLLGMLIAGGVVGCGHRASPYAMIVRSSPGTNVSEALRINDPATIRQLESHFPGYKARPGIMWSGGAWIKGYDVYIDDSTGRTFHIVVSQDIDGSQFWSVAHAQVDREVAGDFEKFVESLEAKRAR